MIKQQVSGTVYGVILNDTVSVQKIGSLDEAPYKGAPKAPVLYIKPANTRTGCGATTTETTAGPRVDRVKSEEMHRQAGEHGEQIDAAELRWLELHEALEALPSPDGQ